MAYCTIEELTQRYGARALVALTDRGDVATGDVDEAVVDRAIDDTGAVIDGYLKGRYALPIAATPPLLRDIALTIAFYRLHAHVAEDKVRKDYDDAMRLLDKIGKGDVRLEVEGIEPEGAASGTIRTNQTGERELTRDNLKGFV